MKGIPVLSRVLMLKLRPINHGGRSAGPLPSYCTGIKAVTCATGDFPDFFPLPRRKKCPPLMKKIADVPYFNGGKERREEGRQKEQNLQYSTVMLRSNIFFAEK